jgi:Na+/melibiose symporter-like transporter
VLALIVIFFVAFIVVPLIELASNERAQYFAKLLVYGLAFVYLLWLVFFEHVVR